MVQSFTDVGVSSALASCVLRRRKDNGLSYQIELNSKHVGRFAVEHVLQIMCENVGERDVDTGTGGYGNDSTQVLC